MAWNLLSFRQLLSGSGTRRRGRISVYSNFQNGNMAAPGDLRKIHLTEEASSAALGVGYWLAPTKSGGIEAKTGSTEDFLEHVPERILGVPATAEMLLGVFVARIDADRGSKLVLGTRVHAERLVIDAE